MAPQIIFLICILIGAVVFAIQAAWEYFFYGDIEGHADDPKVARAIKKLGDQCSFVKSLGSYPNGD